MPDLAQRAIATLLLGLAAPALALVALAIRLDSRGPALYRAPRVGEGGRRFTCYKLRTMNRRVAGGPRISVADDNRVTRVGRLLRRYRLDELPQLWNVVRGEMRLVGPRPEDPAFVDRADDAGRVVFAARPGMTGLAQLAFVDEAAWLGGEDPERRYRELVQPRKLAVDRAYLDHRDTRLDLWILGQTAATLLGRRADPRTISAVVGNEDWRLSDDPVSSPRSATTDRTT